MKICVRENYIDTSVLERIDEKTLKKSPYNFQIVEVPDDKIDCAFEDFEIKKKKYVFSEDKYNFRIESEIAKQKILKLKQILSETDYKAIKFAEGAISEENYESCKQLRQNCRNEINELEKFLNGGKNE